MTRRRGATGSGHGLLWLLEPRRIHADPRRTIWEKRTMSANERTSGTVPLWNPRLQPTRYMPSPVAPDALGRPCTGCPNALTSGETAAAPGTRCSGPCAVL